MWKRSTKQSTHWNTRSPTWSRLDTDCRLRTKSHVILIIAASNLVVTRWEKTKLSASWLSQLSHHVTVVTQCHSYHAVQQLSHNISYHIVSQLSHFTDMYARLSVLLDILCCLLVFIEASPKHQPAQSKWIPLPHLTQQLSLNCFTPKLHKLITFCQQSAYCQLSTGMHYCLFS